MDIIQGKTTVAEASRAYDFTPSEVEKWVDDDKRGMESALRANPLDVKEQYERHTPVDDAHRRGDPLSSSGRDPRFASALRGRTGMTSYEYRSFN